MVDWIGSSKNDIDLHVIEPERHNQNLCEGVIREVRRKWFRTMVRSCVPRKFWDYGMRWVCEVMQRTSTQAGGLIGRTPIESVTGETTDISEYLDFGFYDPVWYPTTRTQVSVRDYRVVVSVSHIVSEV